MGQIFLTSEVQRCSATGACNVVSEFIDKCVLPSILCIFSAGPWPDLRGPAAAVVGQGHAVGRSIPPMATAVASESL